MMTADTVHGENTAAKPMQRMKAAGSEPPHVGAGAGRAGRTSEQQLRGSESSEPAREVAVPSSLSLLGELGSGKRQTDGC